MPVDPGQGTFGQDPFNQGGMGGDTGFPYMPDAGFVVVLVDDEFASIDPDLTVVLEPEAFENVDPDFTVVL